MTSAHRLSTLPEESAFGAATRCMNATGMHEDGNWQPSGVRPSSTTSRTRLASSSRTARSGLAWSSGYARHILEGACTRADRQPEFQEVPTGAGECSPSTSSCVRLCDRCPAPQRGSMPPIWSVYAQQYPRRRATARPLSGPSTRIGATTPYSSAATPRSPLHGSASTSKFPARRHVLPDWSPQTARGSTAPFAAQCNSQMSGRRTRSRTMLRSFDLKGTSM
mmetsp:Transcript_48771/g.144107  ORF Transcript_48771/g.144107 Transcript_48771/m.144107 type:complete len:222 (+) Transcript_48771:384-1049(+)